jgi:hypothetical protein
MKYLLAKILNGKEVNQPTGIPGMTNFRRNYVMPYPMYLFQSPNDLFQAITRGIIHGCLTKGILFLKLGIALP